jgi:hypothetical protein
MNQQERKQKIKENWHKYHVPGMPNYTTLKRNAIFISVANSLKHELKKLEVCYELKSLGKEFLTEAEKNTKKGEPRRRVDVVDLVTGDEIEIETNHKIKKEGAITIYI